MKKIYLKPQVNVVELHLQASVLLRVGSGTTDEALSRRKSQDDDEYDYDPISRRSYDAWDDETDEQ